MVGFKADARCRASVCSAQAVQLRSSVDSSIPSQKERGRLPGGCCLESCCRREKGAQGLGSTGQLDTEMSLALPESTMGSFMLLQLVSQPYWKPCPRAGGSGRCAAPSGSRRQQQPSSGRCRCRSSSERLKAGLSRELPEPGHERAQCGAAASSGRQKRR